MNWLFRLTNAIDDILHAIFVRPNHTEPIVEQPMNAPIDLTPIYADKPETKATLTDFCLAIRDYEGSPGNRNYRNNNPGNCRYSPLGYASKYGVVKRDKDNFAIFKDYETGFMYLMNLVKVQMAKHPDWTILDYISKYHAPASDGNNPMKYALYIEKRLGVGAGFTLSKLIT